MRTLPYRADIDGLRAVAIMLVVVFHVFPETLTGGFTGVDVFFVISGYLITGIILEGLKAGSFSIGNFYCRRIRRLFPSLLLVLTFCFVVGFLALVPAEYFQLSKNLLGGLGFVANFTLWMDSGYFNVFQNENLLLHLWSLGVEEQFYLIWPFMLVVLSRNTTRLVIPVMAIVMLASFSLNIMLVKRMPDLVFYFPFTRLWEICIGALLSAMHYRNIEPVLSARVKDAASVLGVLCILAASMLINRNTWYPGWWGLLPTVGAVLVIVAGPQSVLNRTLLSSRLMVWIGLISYPLYLWHWPIYAYFNITEQAWVFQSEKIAILVLSVLLAWLSYQFVELPVRQARLGKTVRYSLSFASVMVLASVLTLANDGWSARSPGETPLPSKVVALGAPGFGGDIASGWREERCFLTTGQGPDAFVEDCMDDTDPANLVFVWGDSHAAALYPGVRALANEAGFGVGQFTAASCPPLLDWNGQINPLCEAINRHVMTLIEDNPPNTVILHAAWYWAEYDWQAVDNTIAKLKSADVQNIILMGAAPLWGDSVPYIIYQYYEAFGEVPPRTTNYKLDAQMMSFDTRLNEIAAENGITFLSLNEVFCDNNGCMLYQDDILNVTSLDASHLSGQAAVYAVDQLAQSLQPQ